MSTTEGAKMDGRYITPQGYWLVESLLKVADKEIEMVDVEQYANRGWFNIRTVSELVSHTGRIDNVMLRIPVLLSPDGDVIDGRHRVAKAIMLGYKQIPARRIAKMPEPDGQSAGEWRRVG